VKDFLKRFIRLTGFMLVVDLIDGKALRILICFNLNDRKERVIKKDESTPLETISNAVFLGMSQ
jgi:hypothetical protein